MNPPKKKNRVGRGQRHTASRPCPICGGHGALPRGQGRRCHGFIADDGKAAFCTREESAGRLKPLMKKGLYNTSLYPHRLFDLCPCGLPHQGGVNGGPQQSAQSQPPAQSTPVRAAFYYYFDGTGQCTYAIERLDPKEFCAWRPTNGTWVKDLDGVEYHLYRLRELLATPTTTLVCVAEGEKDCDTLANIGVLAVCNPFGAGKWHLVADEAKRALKGRNVVVLPDNDSDGTSHAEQVAQSLTGIAASVKVLELPGRPPEGGDVSDWIGTGGTAQQLMDLVNNCPEWQPNSGAVVEELADRQPERVEWLWEGRIPKGKLAGIDGDPNEGKSTLAISIAASTTTGAPMPFETVARTPANVIILSAEDGVGDTIIPRLQAAGADLGRVCVLRAIKDEDGNEHFPDLAHDIEKIAAEVRSRKAALLIIDPLMAYLGGKVDSHRDQDIRRVLGELAKVAEETGVAVLVVRHLNKAKVGTAMYRGGGSIGIVGAMRSDMLVAPHPHQDGIKILASIKSNLSLAPQSLMFELAGTRVRTTRLIERRFPTGGRCKSRV